MILFMGIRTLSLQLRMIRFSASGEMFTAAAISARRCFSFSSRRPSIRVTHTIFSIRANLSLSCWATYGFHAFFEFCFRGASVPREIERSFRPILFCCHFFSSSGMLLHLPEWPCKVGSAAAWESSNIMRWGGYVSREKVHQPKRQANTALFQIGQVTSWNCVR